MSNPFYKAGNPRFNHVAMSLPADLLDENNRTDLCRFFSEVLGFDEMPTMTIDRRRTDHELRPLGPVHLLDR